LGFSVFHGVTDTSTLLEWDLGPKFSFCSDTDPWGLWRSK